MNRRRNTPHLKRNKLIVLICLLIVIFMFSATSRQFNVKRSIKAPQQLVLVEAGDFAIFNHK